MQAWTHLATVLHRPERTHAHVHIDSCMQSFIRTGACIRPQPSTRTCSYTRPYLSEKHTHAQKGTHIQLCAGADYIYGPRTRRAARTSTLASIRCDCFHFPFIVLRHYTCAFEGFTFECLRKLLLRRGTHAHASTAARTNMKLAIV
eukprot:4125772-Pleurochrysis_carterae.AAC.1